MTYNRWAPEGFIWVCYACGKTSEEQYGLEGKHSRGWDESCVLNSNIVDKARLVMDGDRVTKIIDP